MSSNKLLSKVLTKARDFPIIHTWLSNGANHNNPNIIEVNMDDLDRQMKEAELRKLLAESRHLDAQVMLSFLRNGAEIKKLRIEATYYPFVAGGAFVGTLIAAIKLLTG